MKRLHALLITSALLTLAACGSSSTTTGETTGATTAAPTGSSAAGSASAAPATSPAAESAATWITGQFTHGVLYDQQYHFDDYGTTADVGIALAAIAGHDDEVGKIAATVGKAKRSYISPGYGTLLSAGAVAKLIVLDQAAHTDPGTLVTELDGLVGKSGRLADKLDPKNEKAADYANVIVQSLGVRALEGAGDPKAADVTAYLLTQQCGDGGFPVYFTSGTKASCTSDVDATAFAILALEKATSRSGASGAETKALTWLASQQAGDGSFKASQPAVANANSTGMAGWALGTAGQTDAAAKAATWLARHQLTSGHDRGAVAYDDAAMKPGKVSVKTAGQFRSATSQALVALSWAK